MPLPPDLRSHPAFRRARFDLRGNRSAAKVIIGIGQMHPVLQGRFEGFQARKIAAVQAWIFFACRYFADQGVKTFGQEGLWTEVGPMARMHNDLIEKWRVSLRSPSDASNFLRDTAGRWRRALRSGKIEQARTEAAALNGVALLQVFDPSVHFFPIEQRDVHGVIGAQITALHREITSIEASSAYARARQKQGRGLTKEEYEAMVRRHTLIRAFNKTLTHPERDRSIFREILRAAERQPLTVFILGNAHRRAQLRLAQENLPADTLFLWVTPPQLWWWQAMAARVGWIVLLGLAMAGVLTVFQPNWL